MSFSFTLRHQFFLVQNVLVLDTEGKGEGGEKYQIKKKTTWNAGSS